MIQNKVKSDLLLQYSAYWFWCLAAIDWLKFVSLCYFYQKQNDPFRDYFFWAIDFPTIPGNVIHCQCNFDFLEVIVEIIRIFLTNFNLLKMMALHEDKFLPLAEINVVCQRSDLSTKTTKHPTT